MRAIGFAAILCWLCISLPAQTISALSDGYDGSKLNQEVVAQRHRQVMPHASGSGDNPVVVFTGDRVISQFVDGGYWQTSITVINLENHPTSFDVLFFKDDGTDLYVPVTGQGSGRGMHISLSTAQSYTFETTGSNPTVAIGWALLSQSTSDSIGMFAIFRQSLPGIQPQEAVVPAVNQFEGHFVLPYDNTKYVTGVALTNPTIFPVVIPVYIRDESGSIIDTRQLSLGAYEHTSFVLPDKWVSTAGKRGAIEFLASGFGVGALGLRFNGAAFTSLNVLENFAWTQE